MSDLPYDDELEPVDPEDFEDLDEAVVGADPDARASIDPEAVVDLVDVDPEAVVDETDIDPEVLGRRDDADLD